jgi:hypothetical protein
LQKYLRPAAQKLGIEKTIWLAHLPPYLLDALKKCRHRVQGNAGASPTLDPAINARCLHPSRYAREVQRTSCSCVPSFLVQVGENPL